MILWECAAGRENHWWLSSFFFFFWFRWKVRLHRSTSVICWHALTIKLSSTNPVVRCSHMWCICLHIGAAGDPILFWDGLKTFKTRVINDPLGQSHNPSSSTWSLVYPFSDFCFKCRHIHELLVHNDYCG